MSTPPVLPKATATCSLYEPECIGEGQKILFYTALALAAIRSLRPLNGSSLTTVFRVLVAATSKMFHKWPEEADRLYEMGMPCEASPHITGHGQRPPAGWAYDESLRGPFWSRCHDGTGEFGECSLGVFIREGE
ncbi:hypothetical protein HYC85_031991 [Camellia sinensis]|uniref:Uncharacterized protein n=1 Tax=Camellia sinensis TaxID=4442 RepID=A0A7J7FTY0_CAMSI|nr:hypothetical protein HYC85_031991 [Camellia sinensis]